MCGMIAARNHFRARTRISQPERPRAAVALTPRRAPTRSRVPANFTKGSDDGVLTTPRQGAWGGCGVVTCGRRPIRKMAMKEPAADFSARAFGIVAMMALCQ